MLLSATFFLLDSPAGGNIMYYASTSHSESTIQRPIPGTTDYMKGVISEKWMKGKRKKVYLLVIYAFYV